jgi:hypothetical protein
MLVQWYAMAQGVRSLAPWPHVSALHLVGKLQVYPRHILRENCRPRAISYPDELQTS